jgi:hypothetical protein
MAFFRCLFSVLLRLHAEKAIHGLFPLGGPSVRLGVTPEIFIAIDRTRGDPSGRRGFFRFLRLLAGGCVSLRRRISRCIPPPIRRG